MSIKEILRPLVPEFILAARRERAQARAHKWGIERFAFDNKTTAQEDIKRKYGFEGDLVDIFAGNQGIEVQKWHHYIPLYDRYFSPFRNKPVRFLEIGVAAGGSLQMWRKYFGPEAIIFGIDINPECAKFDGQAGQVRIGSQIDDAFLNEVVREMGGVDIVLDDGSHHMDHIPVTLNCLFPQLSYGGVYMIEDLHAAYWPNLGGGYRSRKNFFRFVGDVIDDMHHWYHDRKVRHGNISQSCSGIHIHDSIVVFEKNKVFSPVQSRHA